MVCGVEAHGHEWVGCAHLLQNEELQDCRRQYEERLRTDVARVRGECEKQLAAAAKREEELK